MKKEVSTFMGLELDGVRELMSVGLGVYYVCEAHGEFAATFIAPSIKPQFGYEPHEFTDDPGFWASNIHPEDKARVFDDLGALFEHGFHTHEYRFRHKDGDYRWVQDDLKLLNVQSDGAGKIVGQWIDITERKRAEAELIEREQRIRLIADGLPVVIVYIDTDYRYRFVNKTHMAWHGVTLDETLGKRTDEIIGIEAFEKLQPRIDQALKGQRLSFEEEVPYAVAGKKWVHINYVPHLDEQGTVQGTYNLVIDITERKEAEAALLTAKNEAEFASLAKTDFLANMSHELRAPLNSVLGFSEVIASQSYGPIGDEKYLEYVTHIQEAGALLLDLINDVLDLSKIEAGQRKMTKDFVDVNRAIETTLPLIKEKAFLKRVKIEVTLHDSTPTIMGDGRAIRQIILNLLSNAIKFTPPGGKVMVTSLVMPDESVVLQIVDTGVGIAPSDMAKVMEPFGQAAPADTQEHEGTGLGLPLSKRLTELQGATFNIESKVDFGTTVRLAFPARTVD